MSAIPISRELAYFIVQGTPIPQGSKSVSRTGHLYEAVAGLKEWREMITWQAMLARRKLGYTIADPVAVDFKFLMPKGHTVKRMYPSVKPDLDKLVRAGGDALVIAKLIKDDALIVDLSSKKRYGGPGLMVTIGMPED